MNFKKLLGFTLVIPGAFATGSYNKEIFSLSIISAEENDKVLENGLSYTIDDGRQ